MSVLKVLISHASLFKKAGWGRIFPLAVGLTKLGNDVTIITTNPKFSLITKRTIINDVQIIVFPEIIPNRISRLGFGFLSLIHKVYHIIFNKYDVVHSDNGHRPLSGIPCRLHRKIHNSVYVAEWYDWYGKGGQYDTKPKLFKVLLGNYELKYELKDKKIADGVVVLSNLLSVRAEKFKPADRIVKIHGGADVSSIPFLYDNSKIKEKYNIDKETITLGYISSKSYNPTELFPLVNTLKKYDLNSKIKILVFGDISNKLNEIPKDILDMMIFFGWIDYANEYDKLQCVDVFFLLKFDMLGNRAGWPNCIGDYLACGRPVLINPVGEVIEFVKKHPFAFIETTREEENIYAKLQFIRENIDTLRETGKMIRKLAEEKISWESKSVDLLNFYLYNIKNKN